MFKKLDAHKKSFQFRHCWLQLKDQPTWHEKMKQLAVQKASNKKHKPRKESSPGSSSPINIDGINQDNSEDVPTTDTILDADTPNRPMGKKKAKELGCRGGSEACIEALDNLWVKKKAADAEKELNKDERYVKTYALDKERLQLEQKRLANLEIMPKNRQSRLANEAESLQLKRMLEEERIIGIDLTLMKQGQKEYYINLQAQIKARGMNN